MAKTYKTTQTLKEENFFLIYPKYMTADVNDKFPEAIVDYEVNGNDLTLELTEYGHKNLEAIESLIAQM